MCVCVSIGSSCLANASSKCCLSATHLGAIAELVRGEIDFPKAALADQLAQRVVADALEIGGRKFTGGVSMPCAYVCVCGVRVRAYSRSCLYELASWKTVSTIYAFARAAAPTPPTTHLLPLCLLFSGGPGIHEKRHLCVETGVLSPSSNTALDLTIGLSRVVVNAAQARPWCVGCNGGFAGQTMSGAPRFDGGFNLRV